MGCCNASLPSPAVVRCCPTIPDFLPGSAHSRDAGIRLDWTYPGQEEWSFHPSCPFLRDLCQHYPAYNETKDICRCQIRTLVNHLRSDILQDFWQGAVPDSTGRAKCRLHVEDDRLPRKSPVKQNNCERRVRTRRLTATSSL